MKKKFLLLFFFTFISCSKQKNINLAKNFYNQCIIEVEDGDLKNALQFINKSIEIEANSKSLALKATILFQLKEYQESLQIFKKIISDKKISPNLKTDIMNNYACNLIALNKNEEAKNIWTNLVPDKNYLSTEVALFNLGLLELKERNLMLAKDYFAQAIEICDSYIDAHFYLALTLFYLNDLNSAKLILMNLLSMSPEHEAAKVLLEKINNRLLRN